MNFKKSEMIHSIEYWNMKINVIQNFHSEASYKSPPFPKCITKMLSGKSHMNGVRNYNYAWIYFTCLAEWNTSIWGVFGS